MELTALHHRLIEKLRDGLPICRQPYSAIADSLGVTDETVMCALDQLNESGLINRFGMILHHRALGYQANAMCVFDLPDARAGDIGRAMATLPYVTLCYRRERVSGVWPFNLYCMIHGQDKHIVRAQIRHMVARLDLFNVPQKVLFSKRCFAQRAGKYGAVSVIASNMAGEHHDPD